MAEAIDWQSLVSTGAELDRKEMPPMSWVVDGIIPEGLTLLAAPPKAGKSWFVLNLALAAASGGKALSGVDMGAPRPVLHLSLEDSLRRLKERSTHLMRHVPLPEAWKIMIEVNPGQVHAIISAFLDTYDGQQPLVIVDVFTKADPGVSDKPDGYRADYEKMKRWKALTDDHPGAGIILVHHTRKMGAEDYLETVSGSNGIAGSCDTIMVLSRDRLSNDGILNITGRDIPEVAYKMTCTDGMWALSGNSLAEARAAAEKASTPARGGDAARVEAFVREAAGTVTPAEIVSGLGIERGRVDTYLSRLVSDATIVRQGRGQYRYATDDDREHATLGV